VTHLSAVLLGLVCPRQLDRLAPETAQHLEGRIVLASAVVSKPPVTWRESTVVGAEDLPDGTDRAAGQPLGGTARRSAGQGSRSGGGDPASGAASWARVGAGVDCSPS
jgi:hypothetical protein